MSTLALRFQFLAAQWRTGTMNFPESQYRRVLFYLARDILAGNYACSEKEIT